MADLLTLEHDAGTAASRLPALLADAETLASTVAAGAHGRRRPGTGETFWQYRDYTQGDSVAAIDWRQSARAPRRLYVRETEWETAATVRLWGGGLNSMDYASHDGPTKAWRAKVLLVATALLLIRAGEKVSLLPDGGPGRSGQRAVLDIAESLITPPHGVGDGLPPMLPPATTQAVLFSDFYVGTEALIERLTAIAGAGRRCHLVEVTDPAETEFPFAGRTLFQAPGRGGEGHLFGDAGAIKGAYRARRKAHRQAVREICARFGFTFIAHQTDSPATPALASLHHAIGGELN